MKTSSTPEIEVAKAIFRKALSVGDAYASGSITREDGIRQLIQLGAADELEASAFLLHSAKQDQLDKIEKAYGIISG